VVNADEEIGSRNNLEEFQSKVLEIKQQASLFSVLTCYLEIH
jgi:hypothetical protein